MVPKQIIIAGFVVIIFAPIALDLAGIKFEATSENRRLKERPSLSFHVSRAKTWKGKTYRAYRDLVNFKDEYDEYYADNFVLKSVLFKPYYYIKTTWFDTNPLPDKVVKGRNGWLFLGDSYSNVIKESKGIMRFTRDEVETIRANLVARKDWLNARGIAYYVAIAPNKHSVYGEYLPIMHTGKPTKLQQLKSELAEINFVDMSEYFDQRNGRLFAKTDTHWNDLGAYYGYRRLIEEIKDDYPSIKPVALNDFTSEVKITFTEGLSRMLDVRIREENPALFYKYSTSKKIENRWKIPSYYRRGDTYENRFTSNANSLKLVMFRDSFSSALIKYLSENFGESVFLWEYNFSKEIIEQEQPDIVITELVERDLDLLLEE